MKNMKKAQKNEKEIIPGLTSADVAQISASVFAKTDENSPQINYSGNGFLNILEKGKAKLSASPVFVQKINPHA